MADGEQGPVEKARAFASGKHQLLIGGQWVEPASGNRFTSYNPATGEALAQIAFAGREDVDRAVAAARAAMDGGAWSRTKPRERAKLLWRLADLLEAHTEEFAALETLDNGMPLADGKFFHVPYAVEQLRYHAGWATKLNGETVSLSGPVETHAFTYREPVGVVAQIVPWNSPLMMTGQKIAPALAAGCAVILKPAEETPLTALRLAHLIQQVGFPEGAFNLLTGDGETAGAGLSEHPDVDKVTFTGSTEVGRIIIRAAAGNFKRVTLELGGKSPVIVMPDADVARATMGAANSIFQNAGQVCAAGSRLFVHERHFDEVIEGIARHAAGIKVGNGLDEGTTMGPVISETQRDRVRGYIKAGVDEGATLRHGGEEIAGKGYYVAPTVLTDTTADMSVVREEIFGPVLCAMSFGDEDLERIAREANNTPYGLGAAIYTRDISAGHKLARMIKSGTVRINGAPGLDPGLPFGGFKQSGWGRENGSAGIEAYTEVKSVAIAL